MKHLSPIADVLDIATKEYVDALLPAPGTAGNVLKSDGVNWTSTGIFDGAVTTGDDSVPRIYYITGTAGTELNKGYDIAFTGGNYGSPATRYGAAFTIEGATETTHGAFTMSGRNVTLTADGDLWLSSNVAADGGFYSSAGDIITDTGVVSGTWNGVAIAADKGGTGLTEPGTAGNVLTSDGTGWVSSPASEGGHSPFLLMGA